MGIRTLVIASLVLGGCNWVLGLDGTRLATGDTDGDLIPDDEDNCPDVANADQADGDADGFGDVCDVCPTATPTNHDEDGDGRGDACDPCPGMVDVGADTDGDGVGDVCDPRDGGGTSVIAFDPFVELGADWQTTGAPWEERGDSIAPASLPDPGLTSSRIAIDGEWTMDIGVTSAAPWTNPDRFGVGVVDAMGTRLAACEVVCKTTCDLIVSVPGVASTPQAVAMAPSARLRFFVSGQGPSGPAVYCTLSSGGNGTVIAPSAVTGAPVVIGSPNIAVDYFAAWSEGGVTQ